MSEATKKTNGAATPNRKARRKAAAKKPAESAVGVQTFPFSVFEIEAQRLGKTEGETAKHYGFTSTALAKWKKDNAIPAGLAGAIGARHALQQIYQTQTLAIIGAVKPGVTQEMFQFAMDTVFSGARIVEVPKDL